ncbi:MAG: hypothetical protein GYB53_22385 [Rhodobacteraceae bacterium]|nr:hypothetical protein [Paracoccaceae bacterium]MBR9820627.1 hypothetical protein [Paracoccaceae bacterium]
MTVTQLASILKERYESAPDRDKAPHVVLFGIEFSESLASVSVAEVVSLSGIGKWGPQVSLGRKLAAHVEPRK